MPYNCRINNINITWPVKTEWWGAGMVICLEQDADLHMAQLMPLPLTVSCFSKIQIGFTFLVPAHPGSPGHRAIKRVCVCVTCLMFIEQINTGLGKRLSIQVGCQVSHFNTVPARDRRTRYSG